MSNPIDIWLIYIGGIIVIGLLYCLYLVGLTVIEWFWRMLP
jgi:hypothetical protein